MHRECDVRGCYEAATQLVTVRLWTWPETWDLCPAHVAALEAAMQRGHEPPPGASDASSQLPHGRRR